MRLESSATDLGYARRPKNHPRPLAPDVTGTLDDIERFVSGQGDNQFYNETLFAAGRRVVYPRITQALWELRDAGSCLVRLEGDDVEMGAIYIDREQCGRLGAPYTEPGELIIAADTLLHSKGGSGYDSEHAEFLSQFGGQTLVLTRTAEDRIGSGWWRVKERLSVGPP